MKMARDFPERDWKLLRELHPIAAERYIRRILDEIRSLTTPEESEAYEALERIKKTVKERDKVLNALFDEQRRSQAVF
jgi:predicted Zn-ribbon and HTH transcriptional regulator